MKSRGCNKEFYNLTSTSKVQNYLLDSCKASPVLLRVDHRKEYRPLEYVRFLRDEDRFGHSHGADGVGGLDPAGDRRRREVEDGQGR